MPQSTIATSFEWSLGSVLAAIGGFLLIPFKLIGFEKRLEAVETQGDKFKEDCAECRESNAIYLASKNDLKILRADVTEGFTEQREWLSRSFEEQREWMKVVLQNRN